MRITKNRTTSVSTAIGAAVLAGGALIGQMATAPMAHADRTVSADEYCSEKGLHAKVKWIPPVEGWCTGLFTLMPGNSLSRNEFPLVPSQMPPGSHKVNPVDPLSAWVIPG